MKKMNKKQALQYVMKQTGLSEIELTSMLRKGATEKDIWLASVVKKNNLGTIKV